MLVESYQHRSRHLTTEEERAQFMRTAPVETAFYWDLIDSIHSPHCDLELISENTSKVLSELEDKVASSEDQAQLRTTEARIRRVISNSIEEFNS